MNRQLFNAMIAQYGKQTVTAISDAEWSGGAHCYLPSLKFYGKCIQGETPSPDAPEEILESEETYVVEPDGIHIKTPILRGIGDYKDEWDYVTGKGIRRIHKVVFDGVSTYGKVNNRTASTSTVAIFGFSPQYKFSKTGGSIFKSTHFKGSWNPTTVGCMYATNLTGAFLTLDATKFPTADSANDWLAEQNEVIKKPVTVYYAMAEPIPFEEHPYPYEPIANDSGYIWWGDGNTGGEAFELTYITHS